MPIFVAGLSITAVVGLLLALGLRANRQPLVERARQSVTAPLDFDPVAFVEATEALMERSERLADRAQVFDQEIALSTLGENPFNGFVYRFDNQLTTARSIPQEGEKNGEPSPRAGRADLEISMADPEMWSGENLTITRERGHLIIQTERDAMLETTKSLEVAVDEISDIELSIRVEKSHSIKLGWAEEATATYEDGRVVTFRLNTRPSDDFQIYRVKLTNILRKRIKPGRKIRKMFLSFSKEKDEEVAIESIRFITKREKYLEQPYGVAYEILDKRLRRVLYQNTRGELEYDFEVPDGSHQLRFGVGVLDPTIPVQFRLDIEAAGRSATLFDSEVAGEASWRNVRLEWPTWARGAVRVRWSAHSEEHNVAFWTAPGLHQVAKERLNIVLVLEDAWRADRLSAYGYGRPTTPFLDEVVAGGVRFENAYSQATRTRPSAPTIATSLYPSATGVWKTTDYLGEEYLTMAEVLSHQGFSTGAFIQNTGNAGSAVGLHQGYDEVFEKGIIGTRPHELFGEELEDWIDRNKDDNFFLYLHMLDPHAVYDAPEPFRGRFDSHPSAPTVVPFDSELDPDKNATPTLEGRRDQYDAEIANNDAYLKRLVASFDERGLLSNTLWIYISDHGEYLGESGRWEHNPPGFRQVIHVPFVMSYPSLLPKGISLSQPVQMIDVMPTILDIAKVRPEGLLMAGDSLLPLAMGESTTEFDRRVAVSQEVKSRSRTNETDNWGSLFFRNWHFLNSNAFDWLGDRDKEGEFSNVATVRLFDVDSDPDEEQDLIGEFESDALQEWSGHVLRTFAVSHSRIYRALNGDREEKVLYDPESLEQLKKLGYLQ